MSEPAPPGLWDSLSQTDLAQIKLTTYNAEVYEPSDDTFALTDAVLAALQGWRGAPPHMYAHNPLPVGSGSGYVTCSIAMLLRKAGYYAHCIAVDVSPSAADATQCTLEAHSILSADVLCGDLVGPLAQRIRGCVDLLVFNPPYVLTPDSEVCKASIAAAWAGGRHGRAVIDRFLPCVSKLLSPCGAFFLVTIADNDPEDILQSLITHGLAGKEVLRRSADEETLHILKCWQCRSSDLQKEPG